MKFWNGLILWTALSLVCWPAGVMSQPLVQSVTTEEVPDLGTRDVGEDWPGFLGPRGDGTSSEKGIAKVVAGDHALRVLWQLELGASYGAVCVSRGRALIFDREGKSARLRCLNSETGVLIWKFEYPINYEDMFGYNNGPRCMPVTDGRLVYTYGPAGKLHCLQLLDGQLVWKVDANDDYGVVTNFFGVGSTPVIFDDLLIVMVGGSPDDSPGGGPGAIADVEGNGSGIVAFDRMTGRERYRITNELASYASPRVQKIAGRDWAFENTKSSGGISSARASARCRPTGIRPSTTKVRSTAVRVGIQAPRNCVVSIGRPGRFAGVSPV